MLSRHQNTYAILILKISIFMILIDPNTLGRFGIGMNTDHTLEEVGQQFSVTRERIRQIEAKALRKLKHPSRSRKLRSFLDS